jgi:thiamine pyrophosphate-dependent acetolactate synthase large subunit-like protein
MMAHSHSRVSGKLGICMATSAPGTINMATGVFDAFADACPIIAIGGASALNQFGMVDVRVDETAHSSTAHFSFYRM